MNQLERDVKVFGLAKEFLFNADERVTEAMLVASATPPGSVADIEGIYRQLLESARSPNMKFNVIGEIDKLESVLCGFSPQRITAEYGKDHERLLDEIVSKAKPAGQVRRTSRSIWPQFCQTALSGAAFLLQFASSEDFVNWVGFFDRDDRIRPALPMLLAQEIHGLGFPVACDFLKELGYTNFCKPDVHLKKILCALQLCDSDDDYAIFKAIVRIAKNNDKKPYEIDKMFWIIGSGWVEPIKLSLGKRADEFIGYAKKRIDA